MTHARSQSTRAGMGDLNMQFSAEDKSLLVSKDAAALTSLPAELIQEIAWLSFNPSIYQVSSAVKSRLIPLRQYIKDLTLLLFCDREKRDSAWFCKVIPWQTPHGCDWNFRLTQNERLDLQKQVFNLEYITIPRLLSMIRFTIKAWIDLNAPFTQCLSTVHQQRLDSYLDTTQDYFHNHWIEDEVGNRLTLLNFSKLAVSHTDHYLTPVRYVVDVEYVPTHLLSIEKRLGDNSLARTLLSRTRMDSLNHQIVKNRSATAKPSWMQ